MEIKETIGQADEKRGAVISLKPYIALEYSWHFVMSMQFAFTQFIRLKQNTFTLFPTLLVSK